MIFAIIFLFVVMMIIGAVVAELRAEVIKTREDLQTLTNVHNWNVQALQHEAEQTQVVRVVEL